MRSSEPLEYAKERRDVLGVELVAGAALELRGALLVRERGMVRTLV